MIFKTTDKDKDFTKTQRLEMNYLRKYAQQKYFAGTLMKAHCNKLVRLIPRFSGMRNYLEAQILVQMENQRSRNEARAMCERIIAEINKVEKK